MKGVRSRVGVGVALLLLTALAVISAASAKSGDSAKKAAISPIPAFSASQLSAAPTTDWIGVHGNILNQQYSALNQINKSTVKNLKVAWHTTVAIPTKGKPNFSGVLAEAQPVEYKGTMYMPDAKGNVFAFDAATGERLWYHKFTPPPHFTALLTTSRGVAIGDGSVYMAATDASVTAINQSTGRENWKTYIGDWKTGATMTAAPIYVNGMLITGIAGGDAGARCQVVALDAKTGKIKWRFDVIPTGSEYGSNTWPAHRAWTGGGAIWNTPAVDSKLGLVYVGVGNPVPYNGNVRGKGQELFTESMVALHLNTGKYAWHYQEVHHDIWDYDVAANGVVLFDLKQGGTTRHLIANAGKTGWVYILDRKTGKPFLGITEKPVPQSEYQNTYATQPIPKGEPFSDQCAPKSWANWKAPDGNPVTVACLYFPYNDTNYTAFAPSALGGADWPPSAYDPQTGNMYICAKNSSTAWKALPQGTAGKLKPLGNFFQVDGLFPAKGSPAVSPTGTVVAMNMHTNKVAWTVKFPVGDMCYSGAMTTAGGLVFVGRSNNTLQAYDANTGKLLWTSPKLEAAVGAAPMTWSAGGKQYVGVYAGGNGLTASFGTVPPHYGSELYAFTLPSS
jgi:PQQ-dependent dehydrogenase (methanol/ethanol family)